MLIWILKFILWILITTSVTITDSSFTTKCPGDLECTPVMRCNDIGKKYRCATGSVCCSSIASGKTFDLQTFMRPLDIEVSEMIPATELNTPEQTTVYPETTTFKRATLKPARTEGIASKQVVQEVHKKPINANIVPPKKQRATTKGEVPLKPIENKVFPQWLSVYPNPYTGQLAPFAAPAVLPSAPPRKKPVVLDPILQSLLYGNRKGELYLKQKDIERIPYLLPQVQQQLQMPFWPKSSNSTGEGEGRGRVKRETSRENEKFTRKSYYNTQGREMEKARPNYQSYDVLSFHNVQGNLSPNRFGYSLSPWWYYIPKYVPLPYNSQYHAYPVLPRSSYSIQSSPQLSRSTQPAPQINKRAPISSPTHQNDGKGIKIRPGKPIVINMIQYQGIDVKLLEMMCQARSIVC